MKQIKNLAPVALVAVVVSTLLALGSRGGGSEPEGREKLFVRAGAYFVRTDRIAYVREEQDRSLTVVFADSAMGQLTLTDGNAASLRSWLESRTESAHERLTQNGRDQSVVKSGRIFNERTKPASSDPVELINKVPDGSVFVETSTLP